jgi:hypothetical protein
VVSVLATGPTGLCVVGSGPAEGDRFLRVIKSIVCTSFRVEVKSSAPCRRFTA